MIRLVYLNDQKAFCRILKYNGGLMIGTKKKMMYEMDTLLRTVFKQIRYEINSLLENELSRNEFLILNLLREQGAKK